MPGEPFEHLVEQALPGGGLVCPGGPQGMASSDRGWLLDRLWHGVHRIAALTGRTHVLIRVKSDITLKRVSEILRDGSYRAEISGDGITMTVRVIEYFADVEGQQVPEMFCLITDLLDWREYPARELAGLYKWRWDGSETGLREAKAPLHGAGPGTGAMLRSGSPDLIAAVSSRARSPFTNLPSSTARSAMPPITPGPIASVPATTSADRSPSPSGVPLLSEETGSHSRTATITPAGRSRPSAETLARHPAAG